MSSREEFEAWAITSAWLGIGEESQLHQDAEGTGYNEIEVHTAWLAWQASRESLVIELPDTTGLAERAESGNEYSAIRLEQQAKCRAAIEAAGVKVKS
jgi:hypothetical protein